MQGTGWLILALCLAGSRAAAWEFSETEICTLSHQAEAVEVVVTYDPRVPEYAIELTLTEGVWPAAAVFGIVFEGGWPLTIQTDRHVVDEGGRRLTVRDSGFGNVLDGIGRNSVATAVVPGLAVPVPLDGAAGPLAAFRACPSAPSA
jgi:hypothetical protein